jgi:hypothetical protein
MKRTLAKFLVGGLMPIVIATTPMLSASAQPIGSGNTTSNATSKVNQTNAKGNPPIAVSPELLVATQIWSDNGVVDLSLAQFMKANDPELFEKWATTVKDSAGGDQAFESDMDATYGNAANDSKETQDAEVARLLVSTALGKPDLSIARFAASANPDIVNRWSSEGDEARKIAEAGLDEYIAKFAPELSAEAAELLSKTSLTGDTQRTRICNCFTLYARVRNPADLDTQTYYERNSGKRTRWLFDGQRWAFGAAHSAQFHRYAWHREYEKMMDGTAFTNTAGWKYLVICLNALRICRDAQCGVEMVGRAEWGTRNYVNIQYGGGFIFNTVYSEGTSANAAILEYELPAGKIVRFQKGVSLTKTAKRNYDLNRILQFVTSVVQIVATQQYTNAALLDASVRNLFGVVQRDGSRGSAEAEAYVDDTIPEESPILVQSNKLYGVRMSSSASSHLNGGFGWNETWTDYSSSYGMGMVLKNAFCKSDVPDTDVVPPLNLATWSYHALGSAHAAIPVPESTLRQNLQQYLTLSAATFIPVNTNDGEIYFP